MATRTERIEARVTPGKAQRIRAAAEVTGASVSAFVVEAAAEKAERVLLERRETVIPDEHFDRLLDALDEPATAVAALEKAAARARRVVQQR